MLDHILNQELPDKKTETFPLLTYNPMLSLQGFLSYFLSSLFTKDQFIIGLENYAGKYCGLNNTYLGFPINTVKLFSYAI